MDFLSVLYGGVLTVTYRFLLKHLSLGIPIYTHKNLRPYLGGHTLMLK